MVDVCGFAPRQVHGVFIIQEVRNIVAENERLKRDIEHKDLQLTEQQRQLQAMAMIVAERKAGVRA